MKQLAKRAVVVTQHIGNMDGFITNGHIAQRISAVTGAPWIHDRSLCDRLKGVKVAILVNLVPMYIFMGGVKKDSLAYGIIKLLDQVQHVVWAINDYTIAPPKLTTKSKDPFRRAFADNGIEPHYWSTMDEHQHRTKLSKYVNWNQLFYDGAFRPRATRDDRILYYGAYRGGRTKIFRRYFDWSLRDKLIVSSNKPAKFTADFAWLRTRGPSTRSMLLEMISGYKSGLYLEDSSTHKAHRSPACRFYEMLSSRTAMLFEEEAIGTMSHYGFDVQRFAFGSAAEMLRLHRNADKIAKAQAIWRHDYQRELNAQINDGARMLEGVL